MWIGHLLDSVERNNQTSVWVQELKSVCNPCSVVLAEPALQGLFGTQRPLTLCTLRRQVTANQKRKTLPDVCLFHGTTTSIMGAIRAVRWRWRQSEDGAWCVIIWGESQIARKSRFASIPASESSRCERQKSVLKARSFLHHLEERLKDRGMGIWVRWWT